MNAFKLTRRAFCAFRGGDRSTALPYSPDFGGAKLQLAAAIVIFLLAATLPYMWLIENFGYDDILREPAAQILAKFHKGGAPLVGAWFAFAMSSLLFIPVVLLLERPLSARPGAASGAAMLGVLSAVVQAIALLRWVLVVPALAHAYVAPSASAASRELLLVSFDVVHRFGGMIVGEMTGQLLLAAWTLHACRQLYRARAVPRWLAAAGALSIPLWVAGQTELLHPVLPTLPSIKVIPMAFMAWEAWLLGLAIALCAGAWTDRRLRA
jgi:hypothetical protein